MSHHRTQMSDATLYYCVFLFGLVLLCGPGIALDVWGGISMKNGNRDTAKFRRYEHTDTCMIASTSVKNGFCNMKVGIVAGMPFAHLVMQVVFTTDNSSLPCLLPRAAGKKEDQFLLTVNPANDALCLNEGGYNSTITNTSKYHLTDTQLIAQGYCKGDDAYKVYRTLPRGFFLHFPSFLPTPTLTPHTTHHLQAGMLTTCCFDPSDISKPENTNKDALPEDVYLDMYRDAKKAKRMGPPLLGLCLLPVFFLILQILLFCSLCPFFSPPLISSPLSLLTSTHLSITACLGVTGVGITCTVIGTLIALVGGLKHNDAGGEWGGGDLCIIIPTC